MFGFSLDTVRVLRRDLYEPNELSPTAIDLEAARPFPGTILDVVLFANPALAFEPLPRDVVQGVDWYRLDQTTQRDLSIIVSSDVLGTFQTFLTDQFTFQASDTSYHIGPDSWTFGPQSHACHGAAFAPKEAPAESTIVALRNFPVGSLHAIAVYAQPGRYALTVLEDYVIAGKGIQRDSHEEDDYCNAVDPPRLPATLPFRDNALTIDNAHDVDWFRFTEPGSGGPVHVRTASLPFGAADSSDIDLYILDVPAPGDTLMTERDRATTAGSTEDVRVSLAPGDYYAVVVDFAGVPTRYAICIGKDPSCDLFPAPPAVGLQASGSRRARLEAEITRRHARLAPLRSGRSR